MSEEEAGELLGLPCFLVRDFKSWKFNKRRLQAVYPKAKPLQFRRSEVLSFQKHLEAPWDWKTGQKRPDIPNPVKHYLDVESAGRCGLCLLEKADYEYAHIRDFAESRVHSPHNLIRLCVACHRANKGKGKVLRGAKERARQRVFLDKIHVDEERIQELRSFARITMICLLSVTFSWLVTGKRDLWPRSVDSDRLAARLSGIAASTSQVVIEVAESEEAYDVAKQLHSAFAKAGWQVQRMTRADLGGNGMAVLFPLEDERIDRLLPWQQDLVYAISDEGSDFHWARFRTYAVRSPDYKDGVVTVRVRFRR
ncbi:MAG: HNH endonuclease signature motif containing protein [Planctomycetota bacterium]